MNSALKTLVLLALTATLLRAEDAPAFVVQEQDANTKTWVQTNELGQVTSSFVEMATGLSRWDAALEKWSDADASIEIAQGPEGGAVAANGQHRVILSADANSANATVDVEMPDGKRIQLQTIGIALTTLDNSRSMFLGEVKQSIGEQIDANTVIYSDAFAPIKASLRLKNTRAGFESDVILEEKIDPADWGFPPECRLEVWSQILSSPTARVKVEKIPGRQVGNADQDEQIIFDGMAFAKGSAFRLDTLLPGPSEQLAKIRVAKELVDFPADDMRFLIESVPFLEAKPQIDNLPVNEARKKPAKDLLERAMAKAVPGKRSRPQSLLAQAHPKGSKNRAMAALSKRSMPDKPGFVMDYQLLNYTTNNHTFKGDTTYFIASDTTLGGSTIFEGGSIVKLTNGASPSSLIVNGAVSFLSSPYRPVVITCVDDHSVGEKLNTNAQATTNAYYGVYGIKIQNSVATNSISNIVIRQSQTAIYMASGTGGEVRHAQIVNCGKGIDTAAPVTLRNVLMGNIGTRAISGTGTIALTGEHVTLNGPSSATAYFASGAATLALTNSIVQGFGTLGTYTKSATVDSFASSPFLPTGAGYFYLNPATTGLRDSGLTTINALLLSQLRQMTTEAPVTLTTDFTASTVLYPTVRRDSDVPDLGYHYNVLDFRLTALNLTNCTLTLTNGVAVGVHGASGLQLRNGSVLISQGTPNAPNRLVRYQTVQEQPIVLGATAVALFDIPGSVSTRPIVRMRFTDVSGMGAGITGPTFLDTPGYYINELSLTDCQLRGTLVRFFEQSSGIGQQVLVSLTNNVFERCTVYLSKYYYSYDINMTVSCYNNLFYGGLVTFAYDTHTGYNPSWNIKDNHFDTVSLSQNGSGPATYILKANNAYQSTTSLGGSSNITLTAFPYATSYLGRWYQGATNMVNLGSRNATNATLFHYTTQTSQTKETNSVVDIGFHYVATDSNGLPLDNDGDGAPDYLEDKNGNGTADSGENSWLSYNSPNLLSGSPAIRIETPSNP